MSTTRMSCFARPGRYESPGRLPRGPPWQRKAGKNELPGLACHGTIAQDRRPARYPGPDGKYGATSVKLMDPSAGGEAAVGLDSSDPAAKDDVVTGTMYLPVGREVDLSLRSVDVIHSFFVPSLRFKQDAVPGLNIHMHFTPTQIGEYEIACAELCGLGHYKMHGMVHVVSQEDFNTWLAAREAEKQ